MEWIPVTEKLPEKGQEVLLCREGESWVKSGSLDEESWGTGSFFDPYHYIDGVTHWMPLPKPVRPQLNGKVPAFQAGYAGSIPAGRSCQHSSVVERPTCNRTVVGSTPTASIATLAQWQSSELLIRWPVVRIHQVANFP